MTHGPIVTVQQINGQLVDGGISIAVQCCSIINIPVHLNSKWYNLPVCGNEDQADQL